MLTFVHILAGMLEVFLPDVISIPFLVINDCSPMVNIDSKVNLY